MTRRPRSIENAKLIEKKVLQRYVYERLVFGGSTERKSLMPPRLWRKKLKVVVPEFTLSLSRKRPDFRLIFEDYPSQNMEVEWTTMCFKHHLKQYALGNFAKPKGYLIVTDEDHNNDQSKDSWVRDLVEGGQLEVVTVDSNDFTYWFVKNSKSFLEGTIAQYSPSYRRRDRRFWVIYISKNGNSEKDYFRKGRPRGIWAFRHPIAKTAKDIFSITTGDVVIFVAKWKVKHRKNDAEGPWVCEHMDIFDVTVGFYCDYEDDMFEASIFKETRKAEDKEYMHCIEFDPKVKR